MPRKAKSLSVRLYIGYGFMPALSMVRELDREMSSLIHLFIYDVYMHRERERENRDPPPNTEPAAPS